MKQGWSPTPADILVGINPLFPLEYVQVKR